MIHTNTHTHTFKCADTVTCKNEWQTKYGFKRVCVCVACYIYTHTDTHTHTHRRASYHITCIRIHVLACTDPRVTFWLQAILFTGIEPDSEYTHFYVCMHACTHPFHWNRTPMAKICIFMYVCMHACMHAHFLFTGIEPDSVRILCMCVYYVCVYVCIHACISFCWHAWMYTHAYIHACTHTSIMHWFTYIHIRFTLFEPDIEYLHMCVYIRACLYERRFVIVCVCVCVFTVLP